MNTVPSLDNGQLFWAAYGLVQILKKNYQDQQDLITRWTNFYQRMAANSLTVFYQGGGYIRAVTQL